MKKLYYLIVLALILGLALTGCSLLSNVGQVPATEQSGIVYLTKGAGDEDSAEEFPLFAGQNMDVGMVKVWNDSDYLYVKYIVDEPWCLTETHLHVADSFDDIPQKNGNPIPGQFEYKMEHDCVPEYLYTIEMSLIPGDELFIATHAVVIQKEEGCFNVISDNEVDWSSDGTTWDDAVACWVHPSWNDVDGATWVWRTEYTDIVWEYDNVPVGGWYFLKTFNVPGEPISGEISINVDNTYELYVNGIAIGNEGSMDKDGPDNHEWATVNTYDLTSSLSSGQNTILVRALNFFRTGSPTSNPAGLAFNAEVCYEEVIAEETAWGAVSEGSVPFPGANWATYFTYTHDGCYILNITSVNNSTGYTHYFTISYDPGTDDFTGTGTSPHAGPQSLTDIELVGNVISFRSDYDNSTYYWFPAFILEDDGTLTFVPKEGDNVWDAQGYWEITYECNGE